MASDNNSLFFYGTLLHPPILHRVIHGPSNPSFPTPSTSYIRTRPAILHGHRRHRVRGADYPAVVPSGSSPSKGDAAESDDAAAGKPRQDEEHSVRGTLATGLTAQDVRRLDIFEGDEYARRRVRVRILRGRGGRDVTASEALGMSSSVGAGAGASDLEEEAEETPAETYIWIAGSDKLEADEWDFDAFKRERMRFWIGGGEGDGDPLVEGETGKEEFGAVDRAVDGTGGRATGGSIMQELEKDYEGAAKVVQSAV